MKLFSLVLFIVLAVPAGAQMFSDITPPTGLISGYYNTAQLFDVDNDGDIDIVITTNTGTSIFYNNDLDFSESKFLEDYTTERQSPSVMDLGDFNRDGHIDILSGGGPNNSSFRVLLNKDPNYELAPGISWYGGIHGPASFADSDNDGDIDIMIDGTEGLINIGDSVTSSFYSVYVRELCSSYWMDFDKDGRVETLANGGSYSTYNSYILEKDSAKHTPIATPIPSIVNRIEGARFADIDSDGDIDMLLRTDTWRLYYNNNNGSFTAGPAMVFGSTAEIADMNNDGKYDIVVAGAMDTWQVFQIQIFTNNGNGTFTKMTNTGILDNNEERPDIDIADIDSDGDLDIVQIGPGVAKLYRNNTVTVNNKPGIPINLSETVKSGFAIFHWSAPTDDHTSSVGLTYNIDIRTSTGKIITPSHSMTDGTRMMSRMGNAYNNNFYKLGCLQEGSYVWKVQALDAEYIGSSFSSERSFDVTDVKPVAPANLQASGYTDKSVRLTWQDNSDNETAFVIQKRNIYLDSYFDVDTIPANSTSYIDTLWLEPNKSYDYRVISYSCAYPTEYSAVVTGSTFPMMFEETGLAPSISTVSNVLLGDVNNDGHLDALISNNGSGKTSLLKYTGERLEESGIDLPQIGVDQSAEFVDVNGDGYLDLSIVFSDYFDQKVSIYLNAHGNDFVEKELDLEIPAYLRHQSWADYDLDGDLDLLLSIQSASGNSLSLFEQTTPLTFKKHVELPGIILNSNAWGDFDNDGDPDILAFVVSDCSGTPRIYKNTGDGEFDVRSIPFSSLFISDFERRSNAAWIDSNADGFLDIVLAGWDCNYGWGYKQLLVNDKNENFATTNGVSNLTAVTRYIDIEVGDINLDGWQDLIMYGEIYSGSNRTRVYFNNNGSFEKTKIDYLIQGDYNGGAGLGDVDQDDDLDLFISGEINWTSSATAGYRNNLIESWGRTNVAPSVPANLNGYLQGNDFVMSWSGSTDDKTPAAAITYEAFVIIDNDTILFSNSNEEGVRKLATGGNAGSITSKILKLRKSGNLKWGVQAIDGSFKGSAFATNETTVDIVTGLVEEAGFHIYPNPAKESFFVTGANQSPQVLDLVGRRVDLPSKIVGGDYEISTQNVKPGLYIVRAHIGNQWYLRKIVIE